MPPCYVDRMFITGVTTASCFYLYFPSGCLKIHFKTIAHLRQGLLRVLFPSDFPAKFLYVFLFSSLRVTCLISTNHTDAKCSASSSCGRRHEGKGKGHLRTGNEGKEGELKYSSTLSQTSALDAGGLLTPRHGRFTPGKYTVPLA